MDAKAAKLRCLAEADAPDERICICRVRVQYLLWEDTIGIVNHDYEWNRNWDWEESEKPKLKKFGELLWQLCDQHSETPQWLWEELNPQLELEKKLGRWVPSSSKPVALDVVYQLVKEKAAKKERVLRVKR